VKAGNVIAGKSRFDLKLTREPGRLTVTIKRRGISNSSNRITVAPAFPLDARIRSVKVQGLAAKFTTNTTGDIQRAEVTVESNQENIEVVYRYDEGTDVFITQEIPAPGAQSRGLRILRSRADQKALHLMLEGIGGSTYALEVRTPHQLGEVEGATVEAGTAFPRLLVPFHGPADTYVRRELSVPLRRSRK
jgi:hypothetical protein